MDPILALGLTLAIEDAGELSLNLRHVMSSSSSSSSSISSLDDNQFQNLMKSYAKARSKRASQIHRLTQLTTFLGHMNYQEFMTWRNLLFTYTPNIVKTNMFDYFVRTASGMNH